jgi:hypothetical protein
MHLQKDVHAAMHKHFLRYVYIKGHSTTDILLRAMGDTPTTITAYSNTDWGLAAGHNY